MSAQRNLAGFRARLHEQGALSSILLSIPSPAVASILGWSGADYVVIDAEHGAFTLESLRACVEAIEPTPAACVIRVAGHDEVLIKQALDLGIDGVQIPTVNTRDEAEHAVRASRYPPQGGRGVGVGRASGYGREIGRYVTEANDRVAVLVMLETEEGLDNVEEIAQVEGLDGIVIGPADLAVSMGLGIDPVHPRMLAAYDRVAAVGRDRRVKVGVGGPLTDAGRWFAKGADLVLVAVDSGALAGAAKQALAVLDEALRTASDD